MKHHIVLILLTCFLSCPAVFAEGPADDSTGTDETRTVHVYDDIDLISAIKYQYGKPRITIKSVYPQLQSDSDNQYVTRFNQLVLDKVQEQIRRFTQQVKENQSLQQRLPRHGGKNQLYIDYDTSSINPNDDQLISIRFSVQAYMAGMAHPAHQHEVLNYNLDTGEQIELSDLFQPNSNYLAALADYTNQVLSRRLSNKEMVANGTSPTAPHFKNWNIKPNGLLFTFDEGEVAPYVNGAQTVLVPYVILKSLISPDSPIADCLSHKKRCWRDNLLTGGFIDSVGA